MKKLSLRNWFYDKILNPYLHEYHPRFVQILKQKIKITYPNDVAKKKEKEIMKVLQSKKYKKLFYKIVNHAYNDGLESKYKPFGNGIIDGLKKKIANLYLLLFNRELYNTLKRFKKISGEIINIDARIDNYMEQTTLDERADRALDFGVITKSNNEAQKRLRKIKTERVNSIVAHNNLG